MRLLSIPIAALLFAGLALGQTQDEARGLLDKAIKAHGGEEALKKYKAGTIKLLAHTGSKRSPILPEIPTLEESGYKVVLDAWYAAFVPSGTPAGIIAKLNSEMNQALKDPKLLETFKAGIVEPVGGTPEEIGKIAQADSVKYARLVKELNIKTN